MQAPCELRIIRVTWAREDHSTDVQTAQEPIPLEYDGQAWVAEVPAYPKVEGNIYGQLAVALPKDTPSPCLLLANDEPFALELVQAPDGREWWIEKGDWQTAKHVKYHDAPLCSHVGEARLRANNHLIRLRIAPTGFSSDEFDSLLDEFRNGAWQLILDPTSPTRATAQRGDGGIDPAFLDAVSEFIRYAGRALDQPHRELREVRQLQRLERVRPHTGTFRELAVRGAPRMISGRGHAPSFNTPENRQLLTMCSRLRRTLLGLLAGAKGAACDLARRAQADDLRADEMQRMLGVAKVDERRLARLIEELESDLRSYPQAVQRLLTGSRDGSIIHRIEARVTKDVNCERGELGFWSEVNSINGQRKRSLSFRFVFNCALPKLQAVFRKGYSYSFDGGFETVREPASHDIRKWWKVQIRFLTRIDSDVEQVIGTQVANLRARGAKLALQGFQLPLNTKDKEDQQRDLAEARSSAERLRAVGTMWSEVTEQLQPLTQQVWELERRARDLGIRKARHSAFTGSMTYVLNPDYRGALAASRRAQEAAGLTASQLDGLLRLEDLGILDLPMIYERWCLLRIVAALREHLNMSPPPDFRERLLDAVTSEETARETVSLRFAGESGGRDLLFDYQPRLPVDGLRIDQRPNPDFMLTLLPRDSRTQIGASPHPTLVLDAKFKPLAPTDDTQSSWSLVNELEALIGSKRKNPYHQPGDHRVFVLHPGPDRKAADRAAEYCHFGGSHLVVDAENRRDWDQGPPDHRYGGVLLRPGVTDPLIRLILMHLYLGLDDSLGAYTNRAPAYPRICPACGSADLSTEAPAGTHETNHPNLRAEWCTNCKRMLVWNFSGGCGTHLFKLGGHWTFHDTHPLNPYNIRCPHCGDYMSLPEEPPAPDEDDERYDWGEPQWPP